MAAANKKKNCRGCPGAPYSTGLRSPSRPARRSATFAPLEGGAIGELPMKFPPRVRSCALQGPLPLVGYSGELSEAGDQFDSLFIPAGRLSAAAGFEQGATPEQEQL